MHDYVVINRKWKSWRMASKKRTKMEMVALFFFISDLRSPGEFAYNLKTKRMHADISVGFLRNLMYFFSKY